MARSTALSTFTVALLILARLSTADDFTDLDSCSKASIPQSNCAESDTKCVCDAANNGYLNKLVDYLHASCDHDVKAADQITVMQEDCRKAGNPIDEIVASDARVYAVKEAVHGDADGGVVNVGADDSTHTITHVPKYDKTTISVIMTQTMVITDDVKTTDSSGNDVKIPMTITSITTKTSESVSTIGTSYVDVTYNDHGGSVYVGDGTVSVGGDYGTVIVGPGSVVVDGSGAGAITTSTTTSRKPHTTTDSNGATVTEADSAPISQDSAGAKIFLATWAITAVVMVGAALGGLFFIL